MVELNVQAAAVRMTRRAQWFLINLPMVAIKAIKRKDTSSRPSPRRIRKENKKKRRESMNALRLPVASTTVQQLRVCVDRAAGFCYRRCSAADGRFHLRFKAVRAVVPSLGQERCSGARCLHGCKWRC